MNSVRIQKLTSTGTPCASHDHFNELNYAGLGIKAEIYPTALHNRKVIWNFTSLVAQPVKNPFAVRKTPVRFLGWEDLLEKGKATHSSILAWRIPWTVQSMGLQRVGHK